MRTSLLIICVLSALSALGQGSFTRTDITTDIGPQAVAVADFNGDGIPDIAALNSGTGSVSILLGKGDGTFQDPKTTTFDVSPRAFAVADFNQDGKQDIVANDYANNFTYVLLGNGDGTFQTPIVLSYSADDIAAGDFNGDGKPDLAMADFPGGSVHVALGDGHGNFSTPVTFPVRTDPSGVESGTIRVLTSDLNHDGHLDLVAINEDRNDISILLGKGDGTFQAPVNYAGVAGGLIMDCAAVGDLNGDGIPDILVGNSTGVGLFEGKGDGTFRDVTSITLPPYTHAVAIGDLDGDGIADLIAVRSQGSPSTYLVYVMLGQGGGTFASPVHFDVGDNPLGTALADLNGDLRLDVVTANQAGQGISVLLYNFPDATKIVPGSGTGSTQSFTFTFDDPNGYADLTVVDVLVNNFLDGAGACYVAFAPTSATSGFLYLVDDAGDGGYASGSPISLPSGGSLHNNQCTISGTGSSVSASGNTLTLTLAVTFAAGFGGNKIFYTAARSASQNSGWQAMGTWAIPAAPPTGPGVGAVSPSRSSTNGQIYTFTFPDTTGYQDLAVVDVLINNFLNGIGGCYVAFAPTSATSGFLYLVDDAGDGGYASGSPMSLPSSSILQNSQCTISGAGSSVSASGGTLTLNLAITFNPRFVGNRVFYLAARNNSTGNSGWHAVGSVTIP